MDLLFHLRRFQEEIEEDTQKKAPKRSTKFKREARTPNRRQQRPNVTNIGMSTSDVMLAGYQRTLGLNFILLGTPS